MWIVPKTLSAFCTGYGGIELGLRRAWAWMLESSAMWRSNAFVQANLVAKIEEGRMDNAPIYSDLKTFPARIFRGKIHGIIGGYPCQNFSSAGKRKGEKDPRHLWPYIRSHVRAIRPLWCFFENVRGHTTMGLWRVLSDLEEDGYQTEWGLFSRRKQARLTKGNESSNLPTATSRDWKDSMGNVPQAQADIGSKGGTLGNSTSERPHRGSENWKESNQKCLGRDLNQMKNWPTPRETMSRDATRQGK